MRAMSDQQLKIGLIGGSGLGETFTASGNDAVKATHELDTPFGRPSGPITVVEWSGVEVCLLQRHGPGHVLNPAAVPYRANVFALKQLGVTHLLASGATGSLREHLHPGELVLVDQFVDKTDGRPRTFFEQAAVHVEFAEPCCPVMRGWLKAAAGRMDSPVTVHDSGTYVCMEGPSFSTRAESDWHRQLGGDLIGMTALPEARLAREAEMAYALIAMPTDYDCWKPHPSGGPGNPGKQDLLMEIIGNLKKATAANLALIRAALADLSPLRDQPSPAHCALALGIWSDKSMLDPEEVERLGPLWGKYFD
jgi:5'-methylthioadenosine phosphorylase